MSTATAHWHMARALAMSAGLAHGYGYATLAARYRRGALAHVATARRLESRPLVWRMRHAIGRALRQLANRVAPLSSYR